MGQIVISTVGSFGVNNVMYSAELNGHADAVATAIEWLSGELLPKSIALDHELQKKKIYPNNGFKRL